MTPTGAGADWDAARAEQRRAAELARFERHVTRVLFGYIALDAERARRFAQSHCNDIYVWALQLAARHRCAHVQQLAGALRERVARDVHSGALPLGAETRAIASQLVLAVRAA